MPPRFLICQLVRGEAWRRAIQDLILIRLIFVYLFKKEFFMGLWVFEKNHRVQQGIRGDCYVKRGVSVSKRLICEHGKFICICSNKGTESDQNY